MGSVLYGTFSDYLVGGWQAGQLYVRLLLVSCGGDWMLYYLDQLTAKVKSRSPTGISKHANISFLFLSYFLTSSKLRVKKGSVIGSQKS